MTASGNSGCWIPSDARTTSPARLASATLASTSGPTIPPRTAAARFGSPSSPSIAAARSVATSSNDRCPWSVSIPPSGRNRFCGVVHIWPLYRDSENARFAEHALVVVGGVDHDAVDARLLGEHHGLRRVRLEPGAERGRPGEVDQPDLGPEREVGRRPVARRVDRERHEVRREAGLGEHVAGDGHGDRQRQHGAPRRLHQHRVAGREAREQSRVAVPGRERRAADEQRDAARHDAVALEHPQRRPLALRLLPGRGRRDAAHRRQRERDRLEPAVLRVRPARLERHRERLARRVHHRVGDLVRPRVEPLEDLGAHRGPRLLAGVAPGRDRGRHGRQQGVDVDHAGR